MADIICRVANGTPRNIVRYVLSLPKAKMSLAKFREEMEKKYNNQFSQSYSQLFCQLGLYYEGEDGYAHVRFDHNITEEEAKKYLVTWFHKYSIPNPYTNGKGGFPKMDKPIVFFKSLYDYAKTNPNCKFSEAFLALTGEPMSGNGNLDIIANYVKELSDSILIEPIKEEKINTKGKKENVIVDGIVRIRGIWPNFSRQVLSKGDKQLFFNNLEEEKVMSRMDQYLGSNISIRQKMFYDYLVSSGLRESSCRQYANTHPLSSEVLSAVKKATSKNSLFDVVDLVAIQQIYNQVKETDTNLRQNHALSATIHNYKKFIDNLENGKELPNNDLVRFKHLLEYFVAHLNYVANLDSTGVGYEEYIQPLVTSNSYVKSGQGWKGHNIQNQISEWDTYPQGKICINVYGAYIGSNATYLNWEGTGKNITPVWDKERHVCGLQLVSFVEKEGTKSWIQEGLDLSNEALGLFDGKAPNENLEDFFKRFCDMLNGIQEETPEQTTVDEDIIEVSQPQNDFDIQTVIDVIKRTELIYDDQLIKRFVYSLQTKPFVILSGLAGSGKTQLALAFAKAMVQNENKQLSMVSVGADWTNREPLLGYPNALQANKYEVPEYGALDLMIRAEKNPTLPFFLILDEMNLSYVERYFADFLSAMESRKGIPLWKGESDDVPQSVSLPKNLFIVGTINVDETTYMFSPKVLDRANVIEFKVDEADMDKFLDAAPQVDVSAANGGCADMAESFVKIVMDKVKPSSVANDVLKSFFKQLKSVNAEFGYRTATEIGRFISLAADQMGEDNAVDAAIVQKLLPKLHGSRKKIVPVLLELWNLCGTGKKLEELEEMKVPETTKYKLAADKVLRMYQCAIDNGFTSFAEA